MDFESKVVLVPEAATHTLRDLVSVDLVLLHTCRARTPSDALFQPGPQCCRHCHPRVTVMP